MNDLDALHTLAARAREVQSLSGEGLITLTRADGESVRLDGAIVMAPPDKTRLRAWKFGRAIFDLTVTPEGVWILAPEDPKNKDKIMSAGVSAAQLAKTWSLLSGGFFDSPNLKTETRGDRLIVRRESPNEPTVVCEVDRRTLTPRRYTLRDDKGAQRFTMTLDRYQQFKSTVWPTRLLATSETGKVEVDLRDVEINPDLPPGVFTAPRRAEKLP
jgi:outer membrane lipoprotein-sorting protein